MSESVTASAPTTSGPTNTPIPQTSPGGVNTSQQTGGQGGLEKIGSNGSSPELFEVKINGRIQKMTRQQVLDSASMATTAHQKFNEAAKMRKEYDALKGKLQGSPIEALMESGLTREQIRDQMEKWYTQEFIEPEKLSADQRRIKELEREMQKREKDLEVVRQQKERDELERATNAAREEIQNQIIETMESSGLPKTKFNIARIAFYMAQNRKQGWDAPMSAIIQQVKNERTGMLSDLSSKASVEQLIEMMPDIISKIRKYDLEQLRAKRDPRPATGGSENVYRRAGTGPMSGSGSGRMSMDEVTRRLNKMRRGQPL